MPAESPNRPQIHLVLAVGKRPWLNPHREKSCYLPNETSQNGNRSVGRLPAPVNQAPDAQPPPRHMPNTTRKWACTGLPKEPGLKGPDNNIRDSFPFHQKENRTGLACSFPPLFSWLYSCFAQEKLPQIWQQSTRSGGWSREPAISQQR